MQDVKDLLALGYELVVNLFICVLSFFSTENRLYMLRRDPAQLVPTCKCRVANLVSTSKRVSK